MKEFWELEKSRLVRTAQSRTVFAFSRALFGFFIFCTAFYCLLFYIPFSRHVLFSWDVVPALSLFAKYHALAFWVAALPASLTVTPYLKVPELRRPTIGLIFVLCASGIALLFHPLLPNLPPDDRSLVFCVVSLFPLCWIAAVDLKSGLSFQQPARSTFTRASFKDIIATAACVSSIYLGIFIIRYVVSASGTFTRSQLVFFALCTFALHVVLFGLIFTVFRIVNAISRTVSHSPRLPFFVNCGLLALALAVILRKVVFSSVTFNGVLADLTAGAIALSFVGYFSTSLLHLTHPGSAKTNSQVGLGFGSIFRVNRTRWLRAAGLMVAISIFAYATLANLEGLDWQGLLHRISVLLVWIATFAVIRSCRLPRLTKEYSLVLLILIALTGTASFVMIQHNRPRIARAFRQHAGPANLLFERYVDYDPSLKVATEMLAPTTVDVFEGSDQDHFFAVLREHTNLPPEVEVAPKDFNLVDEIKPAKEKPNIFIFVIDSLRQDYLSPYNAKVSFTSAIDDFARDSVVMKNAFTRYDGTALAELSIWSGGMQVHKQFVQPFYPMNSLQKLIDAEHYRSFISIDPVLKSILRPSKEIVELDSGVNWKQQDLVGTLSELQTRLQSEESNQPYFVYSQPQNLHQVSLKLNPRAQPVHYAGLEDRRAAEVGRIDKAFGEFVNFLKSRGIYDDSIIVLTADHGDSLGEGGHWGHGNAIYPELIRIPLIVHLPERLKRSHVYDPNSVAFSTDITPSLYYLLGQRPIRKDVMFGRPLFTVTMDEQAAYVRDSYLIGDSYGPVYALLRDHGRTLFVADAIRNQAFIYDLSHSYAGERVTIDDEVASEYQKALTSEIKNVQLFYNYQTPSQVAPDTNQPSKIAQLYSLLFSK
jgi:Sulfatase